MSSRNHKQTASFLPYILALLLVLSQGVQFIQAQTRGFSRDPKVFIVELGEFIKAANKPNVTKTYNLFKDQWESGIYDEDQQSLVIRINQYMMLNKYEVSPDYDLLMKTLLVARDSTVPVGKFNNWMTEAYTLIKQNKSAYQEVLQTSYHIFNDSTLFTERSKTWRFGKADYSFVFKNDVILLELKNADITCKGPDDEFTLYNTTGTFNLLTKTWKGKGGTVTWERVNIDPETANAKLADYEVDMTKNELRAEDVLFTYSGVLATPVKGSLHDRISSGTLGDNRPDFSNSTFPQFTSYDKNLTINNFNDGAIKFKGGFAMEGRSIKGQGDKKNKATFEFYYDGRKVVSATSSNFNITDGKIKSLTAEMTIYTDSGEIYHPMIRMNYNQTDRILIFTRGDKGIEQAPFYDTDHNLEIWVDQIIWKLDEPKINFDMILNDDKARFQSKNFYQEFSFERMTLGMMDYHPIIKMYQFCVQTRARSFSMADYARFLGSKKENLYPQIFKLADEGFIYFDLETEEIRPKEKLFNHYKNHFKLADYDILRFSSVIAAKPNAELNLINYDLKVEGIPGFRFSDSQYVFAVPTEQVVTIKNNRKLLFDGKITAGRFDFYGDNFRFDYESFTVTSDKIDSMKLYYPDTINQNFLIPIKSVLRDINGTLYIDKAHNKSGLTDFPEYPRFVSRAPAVIAYDKKHIFDGAYDKDIFRFEVDPFTIDSMDNFTIEGLKFPGTFVSGGILPEFRYDAYIMKDYSLGFERANPPGGYPMYGGKGHGDIDISMSEEGFWAKGEIQYQGATMQSSKIVMMPDSTNAEVDVYEIKRNERYPRLYASKVKTHWLPKDEEMYINTNDHDVDIFENGQVFTGNLKHTPANLSGGGLLAWENNKLTSGEMIFGPVTADAAVSDIVIGDVDAGMISFVSRNVKSHIDFQKRIGEFRANETGHLTQLPYNQFSTTLDDFKWNMDKKTILMRPTGRMAPEKYTFVSTNPSQDSLYFQSGNALFDMNDGIVYAEEVPYIDIADVRVFPNDGKVTIEKNAYIRTLEQSTLLAARDNKYHDLYDCRINVLGRFALSGTGFHKYKDKHETGQVIYFDKMRIMNDKTYQAIGFISDSIGFSISPKIGYKGSVELNSTKEFLNFNGYVKPLHSFAAYPSIWFRYHDRQDPQDIIVNTVDLRNEDRKKISVSMNYAPIDSLNLYPTFFNFKRTYSDLELTTNNGILYYDEGLDAFIAGDSMKALEGAPRGPIMTLSEQDKTITAEGKLNFGFDLHKNFNILTAGKISKQESDTVYDIETILGMTIKLPDACYDRINEVIKTNGSDAPSTTVNTPEAVAAFAEFLDNKQLEKMRKDITNSDEITGIGPLNTDFMISKAKMYYSPALSAFVSTEPVELASVHGTTINKQYNARVMVETKRSGTRIVFYLEVSKYDWFYFEYYRGNLYVYSTDKDFNEALRQKRGKVNEKGYTLRPASPLKVSRLIEKIDVLTGS
ncbi:MAG: hypothetical protein H6608_00175 [Flavobacteriales bacterium]|nr:hypothetical protein [Bacteroidota bacterium]MCB9239525.1 hypothetical protein [Flavobacteriales bacterium]